MSVLLVLLLSLLSEGLEGAGVLGHGGKEKQRKEEQWKRKRKERERERELGRWEKFSFGNACVDKTLNK